MRPLVLALLVGVSLIGAALPAAAQRFQARLLDQANGLTNLSINAFAQQPDGHLWVATANGVFRFDGSVFKEFGRSAGLTDPSVYSMLIDHTGTLWAGTHGGLFRFDGALFHDVRLGGKSIRIGVNSMLTSTPEGELVAETATGIVSIERDSATGEWGAQVYRQRHPGFPDSQDTDGVMIGRSGELWFGDDGGLCRFAGATVHCFGPEQGVPKDVYVSLFSSRSGRMWARGRRHILTWNPGDTSLQDMTPGLPEGAVITVNRRFTEDWQGHLLTPTAKGFATWNGYEWKETTRTSAGPVDGATDLFADREGSLWIGTDGGGLLHSLGYGLWQNASTEDGLTSPAVGALAADRKGDIWVGNNTGADLVDAKTGKIRPTVLTGLPEAAYIQALAPDPQGGMWAAALQGHLFHLSPEGTIDLRLFQDAYIRKLLLRHDGALWLVTSQGLFYTTLDRKPAGLEPFQNSVIGRDDLADAVLAPDDSLWAVGHQGLYHVETGKVTRFEVPQQAAGLTRICLDHDGSLWLAGRSPGVLHVRLQGQAGRNPVHLLSTYAMPQLTSDLINVLAVDSKDRLWIGTDLGANVIADGKVFHITSEDGLIRDDIAGGTLLPRPDGSLWIGTGKGVSHLIDPEKVLRRPPFPATIEEATYGSASLLGTDTLSWNRGNPLIRFSALTFRDQDKLLFHSQLLGFDAAETVSNEHLVSYPQLPPGSYTFRVYAVDTETGAVSSPAELSFRLRPPWWRTVWAQAIGIALVLGVLAAIWYILNLALLAQRHRLRLMVVERTRELEQLADQDFLTGLLNRRALFRALSEEIELAHRKQSDICVAIVDLDHFKRINDTLGHLAGDEILCQAARRLVSVSRNSGTRKPDILGRYGGEEFLVIFQEAKRSLGVQRAESIRRAVCERPMHFEGKEVTVTCSVGVAWLRGPFESMAQLLAEADRALYDAKHAGRNRVAFAEEETPQGEVVYTSRPASL